MELRHLEYFIAVAEELHFGRAAARLQMTQPPLSQQVQQLEKEIGVQLFLRSNRHVELTNAGVAFLEQARMILSELNHAVEIAQRAARGQIGRLVVGFVGSATYDVLPKIIRMYVEMYPDVDVVLHEMDTPAQLKALQEGRIDIGVLRPPVSAAELSVEVIQRAPCVAAIPKKHPLSSNTSVSLEDLSNQPFIVISRAIWPGFYDEVIGLCHQTGYSPTIRQEATEFQTVIGLVAAGVGISIVPASARNFHARDVLYLDLKGLAPTVEMAVAWRRSKTSSIVEEFLSVVRSVTLVQRD